MSNEKDVKEVETAVTPKEANQLLELLKRVSLQGSEAVTFVKLQKKLTDVANSR